MWRNSGEVWMKRQEQDSMMRDGKRRRRFSSAEGRRFAPTTGKEQANAVEAVKKRKGNEAEILLEKRPRSGFFDNVRVCILKQSDEGFARRWVPSVQHIHDDPTATCCWDGDDASRQHSSDFSMDEIQRPRSGFFDNVRVCILQQDVEEFSRRWVNSVQHVHDDPSWWDGDDGSTGRQHSSDSSMDEIQLEKSSGFFDNVRFCILEQDVGRDEELGWVPSVQQDDPSATCWWDGDDGSAKSSGRKHFSDFSLDEIPLEKSGFFYNELDTGRDERSARRWVPSVQQDDPSATCWWDGDDGSAKSSGRKYFSDFSMDEIPLEKRPRSGFFDNEQDIGRDERFARRWVPSVQQHDPSATCWWDDGGRKSSGRQHSSDISMDEMRLAISKSMEDMERTQEKMRESQHEVRIAKRKVDTLWEEIEAATPLRRAHYQALVEAERAQA